MKSNSKVESSGEIQNVKREEEMLEELWQRWKINKEKNSKKRRKSWIQVDDMTTTIE